MDFVKSPRLYLSTDEHNETSCENSVEIHNEPFILPPPARPSIKRRLFPQHKVRLKKLTHERLCIPSALVPLYIPWLKPKQNKQKILWTTSKPLQHGFDVFATPPKILPSRHGEENRRGVMGGLTFT